MQTNCHIPAYYGGNTYIDKYYLFPDITILGNTHVSFDCDWLSTPHPTSLSYHVTVIARHDMPRWGHMLVLITLQGVSYQLIHHGIKSSA
jgi:hypothetical protein